MCKELVDVVDRAVLEDNVPERVRHFHSGVATESQASRRNLLALSCGNPDEVVDGLWLGFSLRIHCG